MDGKRFQDWLASIDSLSETQRTEALAVLSGQADDVCRWRRSRRKLRKTDTARIAARRVRYHAAGHGVFAATNARAAGARSMPRPERRCRGFITRNGG